MAVAHHPSEPKRKSTEEVDSVFNKILKEPNGAEKLLYFLFCSPEAMEAADLRLLKSLSKCPSLENAEDRPTHLGVVERLTPNTFDRLYDPSLPTIGFVARSSISGSMLIALASALDGKEKRCNVVLIPPFVFPLMFLNPVPRSTIPHIKSGAIFDSNGTLHVGDFPRPIELHLFDHSNAEMQIQDAYGYYEFPMLISQQAINDLNDKTNGKEMIAACRMKVPSGVVVHLSEGREHIEHALQQFLDASTPGRGLVLKPLNASGGYGVHILPEMQISELTDFVMEQLQLIPTLILEERIPTIPLVRDGKLYDWNLRVLSSPSGIIDWEVRVHDEGLPVNKCRGASIEEFSVKFLAELLGDSAKAEALFPSITESIATFSKRICQVSQAYYLGIDILISLSQNGDPVISCIEANAGAVGGIESLSEIRHGLDEKLRACRTFIDHLLPILRQKMESTSERPKKEMDEFYMLRRDETPTRIALLKRIPDMFYASKGTAIEDAVLTAVTQVIASLTPEDLLHVEPAFLAVLPSLQTLAKVITNPTDLGTALALEEALKVQGDDLLLLMGKLTLADKNSSVKETYQIFLRMLEASHSGNVSLAGVLGLVIHRSPYLASKMFEKWKEKFEGKPLFEFEMEYYSKRGDAAKLSERIKIYCGDSETFEQEEECEAYAVLALSLYFSGQIDELYALETKLLKLLSSDQLPPEYAKPLRTCMVNVRNKKEGHFSAFKLWKEINALEAFRAALNIKCEEFPIPRKPPKTIPLLKIYEDSERRTREAISDYEREHGEAPTGDALVNILIKTRPNFGRPAGRRR